MSIGSSPALQGEAFTSPGRRYFVDINIYNMCSNRYLSPYVHVDNVSVK